MAIKAGGIPLMQGAPVWLAASWWNYIPLVLLTFYLGSTIFRQFRPLLADNVPHENEQRPKAEKPKTDYYAIRHAIDAIKSAKRDMLSFVNSRDNRKVELKLHDVRAALLTAYRQFDLPRLPAEDEMRMELLAAERYIELVLPYLEEKHFDEARAEAQRLVDKLTAPREASV